MRIAVLALLLLSTPAMAQSGTTAPQAPGYAYNVTVDDITETTATVHWMWAQGCDPGDVFVTAIPDQGNYHGERFNATGSSTRQETVTRLFPGTLYRVRIEPVDTCGQGQTPPDPQVEFRTAGTRPQDPGTTWHVDPHMGYGDDFTVVPGRRSATFRWDWTPGCASVAELRVRQDDDGQPAGEPVAMRQVDAREDGPHEYQVEGLRPGTDYWAHVVVTHQCGIAGGGTESIQFRTLEARTGAGIPWALGVLAIAVALLVAVRRRI